MVQMSFSPPQYKIISNAPARSHSCEKFQTTSFMRLVAEEAQEDDAIGHPRQDLMEPGTLFEQKPSPKLV